LGGTYSGTGVNSSTAIFTPSAAGSGTAVVSYTCSNWALCTAAATRRIHVLPVTSFTCGNNLTDPRDNRVYPTVKIGSQCWMKENLDYGTVIPDLVPQADNCIPEKYMRATSYTPHPVFYQWDELMQYTTAEASQGLCPPGWHIPAPAEWDVLVAFCTGAGRAAGPLKDPLLAAGFYSLQQGFLYQENTWVFETGPIAGSMYWTSAVSGIERSVARGMNEATRSVSLYNSLRGNAFPVRCLKDQALIFTGIIKINQ
ncbi:MAG: FISUMP domain-containing protein, partial [Bacteroidota bacterium]